jgi:hypothetical protein
MRFHPFHKLGSKKNIIVDGAAQEHSVLVLSHWPASPTPDAWLRDTSAEIVLDFLANEQVPEGVELVSNNHFDEDGLFGICALIDPEFALAHRERFVDAATAGDFGRYRERDAARANFAITKLVSEVPEQDDYAERAASIYEALIPVVPRLIDDIGQFEAAWREEDQFLDECERWLDQGSVQIEEDDGHDLAVVRIPADLPARRYSQFGSEVERPLHRMAVFSRTSKARVLFQQGRHYWFRYRYETWVKFVSERHPFRVDLAPLCQELNALELDGATWAYDGSSNITPAMRPTDGKPSSLDLDTVLAHLCRRLENGEVDWNPFEVTDSGHA